MQFEFRRHLRRTALSVLSFAFLSMTPMAPRTRAEIPFQWQDGYAYERNVGGNGVLAFDPDGPGPAESTFITCGQIPETCIFAMQIWQGHRWSFMGGTIGGVPWGTRISPTLYQNQPVVGRYGSPTVIRWEGADWQTMGDLSGNTGLVEWAEVGGVLFGLGGQNLFRWDGTDFVVESPLPNLVLTVHEFQGALVAGGSFTQFNSIPMNRVMSWNGAQWSPLGQGIASGTVYDLTVLDGNLLALARDGTCPTCNNRVMAWDGAAWTQFGPTLDFTASCMLAIGDELYVGGNMIPQSSHALVRWDGAGWDRYTTAVSGKWSVAAMTEANGKLIVSGTDVISSTSGVPFIASWDGEAITFIGGQGFDRDVYGLHSTRDELFAAGRFNSTGGGPAYQVAEMRNGAWGQIGSSPYPFPPSSSGPYFDHIYRWDDGLVAIRNSGGLFFWDGVSWTTQNPEFFQNGSQRYLIGSMGGRLVCTHPGLYIREDGQWRDILPEFSDQVYRYWVRDEGIVAYLSQGPNSLALWDGNEWRLIGSGPTSEPRDVVIHHGKVIAATYQQIVMFDDVPTTLRDQIAQRLFSLNGELLAVLNDGSSDARVSIWNGETWRDDPYIIQVSSGDCGGSGTTSINAVIRHQDSILFGGKFEYLNRGFGFEGIHSSNIAALKTGHPPGDMNADDAVDLADVPQFVAGLLDPSNMSIYATLASDVNADGRNNGEDLSAFIDVLLGDL